MTSKIILTSIMLVVFENYLFAFDAPTILFTNPSILLGDFSVDNEKLLVHLTGNDVSKLLKNKVIPNLGNGDFESEILYPWLEEDHCGYSEIKSELSNRYISLVLDPYTGHCNSESPAEQYKRIEINYPSGNYGNGYGGPGWDGSENSEIWLTFKIRIPKIPKGFEQTIVQQWHSGGPSDVGLQIEWNNNETDPVFIFPGTSRAFIVNTWYTFTYHIKWSTDETVGFVEIKYKKTSNLSDWNVALGENGDNRKFMATMVNSNKHTFKAGIYRGGHDENKSIMEECKEMLSRFGISEFRVDLDDIEIAPSENSFTRK